MYVIRLTNSGGELSRGEVERQEEIKQALIEMIHECARFQDGDTFTIEGSSDVHQRTQ